MSIRCTAAMRTGGSRLLVAAVLMTGAPAAEARTCANTFGGDIISAENMECNQARAVVRAWARKYREDGVVNRRARGFSCRGRNDQYEGLTIRCRLRAKQVRFYANVPA